MRIYWHSLLSFFLLAFVAGCGQEQIGTVPQSTSENVNGLVSFTQGSCANHTLVKPVVDVLYLVDNSSSTFYIPQDVRNAIAATASSISQSFDYRIIGAPLLSSDNDDFQVLAKDPTSLGSSFDNKKVTSASQFSFFSNTNTAAGSAEPGTRRVVEFLTAHSSDGLFRQGGYLFVVLVSNGRDTELEYQVNVNGETAQYTSVFNTRKTQLINLKNYFASIQFRLFTLSPLSACNGWRSSQKSYAAMSKELYLAHTNPQLSDQAGKQYPDNYDLCGSVSSVFASANSTIQQIIVPHTYNKWPITFTDSENMDVSKIKVFKQSPGSGSVEMTSGWTYYSNSARASVPTRILPTVGEPSTARHLVEFDANNYIVYPDCVTITSSTNLEYFQYIVLDKKPQESTITVTINGVAIPKSTTNGWNYENVGYQTNKNIKVSVGSYSDQPAALRSGFFIKLNGTSNYYKSGDSVQVNYLPDSI